MCLHVSVRVHKEYMLLYDTCTCTSTDVMLTMHIIMHCVFESDLVLAGESALPSPAHYTIIV